MIRLRIDRSNEGGLMDQFEGLVWFEGKGKDRRMSRVIIEQFQLPEEDGVITAMSQCWVPVEVIDEQT